MTIVPNFSCPKSRPGYVTQLSLNSWAPEELGLRVRATPGSPCQSWGVTGLDFEVQLH